MRLWRIFIFSISLDNYSKSHKNSRFRSVVQLGSSRLWTVGKVMWQVLRPYPQTSGWCSRCGQHCVWIWTQPHSHRYVLCLAYRAYSHKKFGSLLLKKPFADLRKLSENSFWAGFENIVKLDKPFLCFADWIIILIYIFDWLLQKYGQIITPK